MPKVRAASFYAAIFTAGRIRSPRAGTPREGQPQHPRQVLVGVLHYLAQAVQPPVPPASTVRRWSFVGAVL